jgi:uncharacterized protein
MEADRIIALVTSELPKGDAQPAAGWYHDGNGQRWWDGHQWGPYAPPRNVASGSGQAATNLLGDQGRTAAIFCHVGYFLLAIVLAAILRSTDDKNPFVRQHATEALNFQITIALAMIALFVVSIPLAIVTVGVYLVVTVLLAVALSIVGTVYSILGAIEASRMKPYVYPFSIRFVNG